MTTLQQRNDYRHAAMMAAIEEARYLRSQGCLAWEICLAVKRKPAALAQAIKRHGTEADRTGTEEEPSLQVFFEREKYQRDRDSAA